MHEHTILIYRNLERLDLRILFRNLTLVVLIATSGMVSAQDKSLTELVTNLAAELTDVTTEKYEYAQSLTTEADQPWRITVTITETSKKSDKSETTIYQFNLADIDPNLVNIETSKDEQLVVLKCRKRQTYISVTDEDGDVDYEADFQVWTPEIDKATTLKELFREAAREGMTQWEAEFTPSTTLPELQRWLADNIQPVTVNEETANAEWSFQQDAPDLVTFSQTEPGESVTIESSFSLADLQAKSVELEVKSGQVSVEAGTSNRLSGIRKLEDGEFDDYEDQLQIPAGGIDEARRISQVLEKAIGLAGEVRRARFPKPGTLEDGLARLASLIKSTEREEQRITATLTPSPLANLEVSVDDAEEDETTLTRDLFDFGDLDPKKVKLQVKGDALFVTVGTRRGEDFVQRWEAEDDTEFEDEVTFPAQDIETATEIVDLLPFIIAEAAKLPVTPEDFAWLTETTAGASNQDFEQLLELGEEDCKWRIKTVEEGKRTEENLYEFNLYDIDGPEVEYEVGREGVAVVLPTVGRDETINHYENDEPKFVNEATIVLTNLADAKKAAATIKELVKGCAR